MIFNKFLTLLIAAVFVLPPMAISQESRKKHAAFLAIESDDLAAFKQAVRSDDYESDGRGTWTFDGAEESNLIMAASMNSRWKMLAHLFSLGAPKSPSRLAEFAAKVPTGGKIIDTFIENHPEAKGVLGTRLLCDLIQRFDIGGKESPHPLIVQLVEAGAPLESGRYSTLIAAIEFRDLVLIKYFKSKGAKVWKRSKWLLNADGASAALGETEYNAVALSVMTRSFDATEALVPRVDGMAEDEMKKFRKAYPRQPGSPFLGIYEVVVKEFDPNDPIPTNLHFRLLSDSTAFVPMAGLFNAAAWVKKDDKIEFHSIGVDGPVDGEFNTVLKISEKPGVLEVVKLRGNPVTGVTAHLMGGGDKDEFSVPADSPAIGKWRATFEETGAAEIEIEMELRADGKGVMLANEIEMKLVWKHLGAKDEIESYVVQGGQVKRSSAMKMKISENGDQLIADDDSGMAFEKVK